MDDFHNFPKNTVSPRFEYWFLSENWIAKASVKSREMAYRKAINGVVNG